MNKNKTLTMELIITMLWLSTGYLIYLLGGELIILYTGLCILYFVNSYLKLKIINPVEREIGFLQGISFVLKYGKRRLEHGRKKSTR